MVNSNVNNSTNDDLLDALMSLRPGNLTATTEKELTAQILEECVKLTNSDVGYLHFYDEETKDITLNYWSKNVFKSCGVSQDQHYPLEKAGNWADCVRERKTIIHNDFATSPNQKGVPEGHFPINRHMSVPIFKDDKIVLILGVGNKELPYDDSDVEKIEMFGKILVDTFEYWKESKKIDQSARKYGVVERE